MAGDLKLLVDVLIEEGEWRSLGIIANTFGGWVYDYIQSHEDCPW